MVIPVQWVRPGAERSALPQYMTPGAAGMDLLADVDASVELKLARRVPRVSGHAHYLARERALTATAAHRAG